MATSTLTSWALLVWNALQASGHDARDVFAQVGLDPAKLGDGNARYPMDKMLALWNFVIEKTGDPCFGLEVGRRWSPTTFHALGFAWLASPSLCDGLLRLHRYSKIVNNSLQTTVKLDGKHCILSFTSTEKQYPLHPAAADAGICAVITMCRLLCGDSFRATEIRIAHHNQSCAQSLEAFVQAPLSFGANANVIIFDRQYANRQLPTSNPELARINEQVAMNYMNELDLSSLSHQVQAKIRDLLPSGEALEEIVAKLLNMSVRTMLRRLSEEGTNYKSLLDQTRQELAQNYLLDSQLSINEIAYLVGFAEQANFTRAFRRWYGTSPSEYRKEILTEHNHHEI